MDKEGYSREAFDAAQSEAEAAKKKSGEAWEKSAEKEKQDTWGATPAKTELKAGIESIMSTLGISKLARAWAESDRAEKKLADMMKEGREEASELNERYARLQEEAARAVQAVQDFERDKLGMGSEKKE